MTEQPDRQATIADLVVGQNIAIRIANLVTESSALATSLGTYVTGPQLLAGLLATLWDASEKKITREEFAGVYDNVLKARAAYEKAESKLIAGGGPDTVADAESAEEASALADAWGSKIEGIAFGLPEFDTGPADEDTDNG